MRKMGDVIKILREENRMTQRDLAKTLGVAASTVGMWESGERSPNEEVKEHIADYFNVDMDFLYGRTNIRNSYREGAFGVQTDSYLGEIKNVTDAVNYINHIEQTKGKMFANRGFNMETMTGREMIEAANGIKSLLEISDEDEED